MTLTRGKKVYTFDFAATASSRLLVLITSNRYPLPTRLASRLVSSFIWICFFTNRSIRGSLCMITEGVSVVLRQVVSWENALNEKRKATKIRILFIKVVMQKYSQTSISTARAGNVFNRVPGSFYFLCIQNKIG